MIPEETKNIRASLIIEVMGKPPEHVTETLSNIVKQMDEEKGISVRECKISEPKELEKAKTLYSCFADIEVEVEEVFLLTLLVFKYTPSHIEIISPETIVLNNSGWNDVFNEITGRLHNYDEIARVLQMEKTILEKKLRELLEQGKKKDGKKIHK